MATRRWKDIAGFPGYQVSDDGLVRSPKKVLKNHVHITGYHRVTITRGHHSYVHTLVLMAFLGPRPAGYDASHINGVRTDNRVENLCWESRKDNMARTIGHGSRMRGERVPGATLTNETVRQIKMSYKPNKYGETIRLAREFDTTPERIVQITNGRAWAWLKIEGQNDK